MENPVDIVINIILYNYSDKYLLKVYRQYNH